MRYLSGRGDPLILSVTVMADALPYRCTVATDSGRIREVKAARDHDNMARTGMTLLRQLGDDSRGDALLKFFGHEAHFVRWHAMREYAALRGADAIPELQSALAAETSPYLARAIDRLIEALRKLIEDQAKCL